MYKFKVPQYLHLPYQVLFFEIDDLVLLLMFIFVSVYFSFSVGLVILIILIVYVKFKRRLGRGFLFHVLYAIGFVRFKGYPLYLEKRFTD